MQFHFFQIVIAAMLVGCAHTQPPAAASLEGKPRVPVNQQSPAPVTPASTSPAATPSRT